MLRLSLVTLILIAVSTTPSRAQGDFFLQLILAAGSVDDGVAPLADVYGLGLSNGSDSDINAIGIDLKAGDFGVSQFIIDTGGFYNPSDLTAAGNSLPEFRGVPITDSFVVVPEGLLPLAVNPVFESDRIIANYTTAGGVLVPAFADAIIAHLSVPSGEVPNIPSFNCGVVRAVYSDPRSIGTNICPEPSTGLLACLALVFAWRRCQDPVTHWQES